MSPELIDNGIIIISGVVASLLTAWINKAWWTTARRQWVSFCVSVVLSIGALILKGIVTPPPSEPFAFLTWVVTTIGLVSAASQIIYMQFSEKIRQLEDKMPSPIPEGKRFS